MTSTNQQADRAYPLIDRRCRHHKCDEPNVYRMVGHCANCDGGPFLILVSARHEKPLNSDCPKCGCWTVHCDRAAEGDELPLSEPPLSLPPGYWQLIDTEGKVIDQGVITQ